MKLSQLIKDLQNIQDNSEQDLEVVLSVRDYYSKYGVGANISINTTSNIQRGYFKNDRYLTISAYLEQDLDGKNPKVTFRK